MKLDYDKCKHCKYFIQHYNIDFGNIWKVSCGHCTKNISTTGGYRIYSGKQPCPYFEQNKGQCAKIKKRKIADLLEELNINIECVKLFLNKDKSKQEISNTMIDDLNNKN